MIHSCTSNLKSNSSRTNAVCCLKCESLWINTLEHLRIQVLHNCNRVLSARNFHYFCYCSDIKHAFKDILVLFMLFMSMGWDYVSELRPPVGLLFIPQMICERGEPRWNDIDRGQPKNSEINLSQCHFVHHKTTHGPTWARTGATEAKGAN
jgi:hypothetical protein